MERVLGDFRYIERGLVTYIFVCWCVCVLVFVWCGCGLGESSGEGVLSFHQKIFLMN